MFKRSVLAMMLVAATPAMAHTGHHAISGLLSGFGHPLTGLDHTLAMVGVGLFSAWWTGSMGHPCKLRGDDARWRNDGLGRR
jgi:urease accessory protein